MFPVDDSPGSLVGIHNLLDGEGSEECLATLSKVACYFQLQNL